MNEGRNKKGELDYRKKEADYRKKEWKMDVLHEGDNAAIWTAGLCLLWYF